MNLGDSGKIAFADVLRVPGGWIFSWGNSESQIAVFVPFNNEFMEVKK